MDLFLTKPINRNELTRYLESLFPCLQQNWLKERYIIRFRTFLFKIQKIFEIIKSIIMLYKVLMFFKFSIIFELASRQLWLNTLLILWFGQLLLKFLFVLCLFELGNSSIKLLLKLKQWIAYMLLFNEHIINLRRAIGSFRCCDLLTSFINHWLEDNKYKLC
jgi:hypothetical protein